MIEGDNSLFVSAFVSGLSLAAEYEKCSLPGLFESDLYSWNSPPHFWQPTQLTLVYSLMCKCLCSSGKNKFDKTKMGTAAHRCCNISLWQPKIADPSISQWMARLWAPRQLSPTQCCSAVMKASSWGAQMLEGVFQMVHGVEWNPFVKVQWKSNELASSDQGKTPFLHCNLFDDLTMGETGSSFSHS